MTKLSYDIIHNGKVIKNVVGYQEACDIVAELGPKWKFKAVYTEFNPDDTPERRKAAKEHAEKVREAIARKALEKELRHAPSYVNNSGVGAS